MDKLPDAELEVLKVLWQLGKSTAKQIRENLKPQRDHATISTLLRRLESRKLVRRSKSKTGREFIYSAIAKPEKTRQKLVKDFLQRAFDGSGIEMVQALFQTKSPTPDEIEQLEKLLDDLKDSQDSKQGKSK